MNPLLHIDSARLRRLGIARWGYTEEDRAESFPRFREWIARGVAAPLGYLTGERARKRESLKLFYPEFASALVFLFDYSASRGALEPLFEKGSPRMAAYGFAFGEEDYHRAIPPRLAEVGELLRDGLPELEWKVALDVHPVLDRELAWRCGLGWFGKNSMLIHRELGSFFLIGSLLLNRRLGLSSPAPRETDHCGSCQACAQACPTDAIDLTTRTLRAERCISTFTIEQFKEADDSGPPKGYPAASSGEIFGCDICQDVCPWNHRPGEGEDSLAGNSLAHFFLGRPFREVLADLRAVSGKEFKRRFGGTVLGRGGKRGMLKNLKLFE